MQDLAKAYLKHFVIQAKKRADDMIIKFVNPFEKYIKRNQMQKLMNSNKDAKGYEYGYRCL